MPAGDELKDEGLIMLRALVLGESTSLVLTSGLGGRQKPSGAKDTPRLLLPPAKLLLFGTPRPPSPPKSLL